MPASKAFLIIAESGRALAASAARAGYQSHLIDRFNDEDTLGLCLTRQRIDGTTAGLDLAQLPARLTTLLSSDIAGVVTGGGLEQAPDWHQYLPGHWPVFANTASCLRNCKQPDRFFPMLDTLGVDHPQVSFHDRKTAGRWLVKKTAASGGGHVSVYTTGETVEPGWYLQEWIAGRTFSAVFIGNGQAAELVGVTETRSHQPAAGDFRYRGAISLGGLDQALLRPFQHLVQLLSGAFKLRGLCGVDVILDDSGRMCVLEINPRPTATFSLHESSQNLFTSHVQACRGTLPNITPPAGYRAHEIIYTPKDGKMWPIDWPDWVTDRPATGEWLTAGEPLCTVHAAGETLAATKRLLQERVSRFLDQAGLQEQAA